MRGRLREIEKKKKKKKVYKEKTRIKLGGVNAERVFYSDKELEKVRDHDGGGNKK